MVVIGYGQRAMARAWTVEFRITQRCSQRTTTSGKRVSCDHGSRNLPTRKARTKTLVRSSFPADGKGQHTDALRGKRPALFLISSDAQNGQSSRPDY